LNQTSSISCQTDYWFPSFIICSVACCHSRMFLALSRIGILLHSRPLRFSCVVTLFYAYHRVFVLFSFSRVLGFSPSRILRFSSSQILVILVILLHSRPLVLSSSRILVLFVILAPLILVLLSLLVLFSNSRILVRSDSRYSHRLAFSSPAFSLSSSCILVPHVNFPPCDNSCQPASDLAILRNSCTNSIRVIPINLSC
jgi:hypothetical protein